jgi:hypothetical protein
MLHTHLIIFRWCDYTTLNSFYFHKYFFFLLLLSKLHYYTLLSMVTMICLFRRSYVENMVTMVTPPLNQHQAKT